MAKSSKPYGGRIRRRIVLQSAAALAIAGPAVLGGGKAGAQPRMNAPQSKVLFVYVGAFTTPERKGKGDGINVYRMDPSSGVWTHLQLVPNIVNPSFLALDREQRFLYSVHADLDEVSAYAIDKQTGQLTPLNRQSCGGKNPVYLAIDPTNRFIVTANYGAGSVGVVPIEKDGTLGARTDLAILPGEPGPNRKEQASSHPHDCPFDPAGRFILVPDKGLDRVFGFHLEAASGKLTPNDPPFVATREGAGPRHIAFQPAMPYAYVIDELELDNDDLSLRSVARRAATGSGAPHDPIELHGQQYRRGGCRRAVGAFCLWLEPRARQYRHLCRRSRRGHPDPGRLGTDAGQDAALLRA